MAHEEVRIDTVSDSAHTPKHTSQLYIGPSGWRYPDWDGVVYSGPAKREHPLRLISSMFNVVEVNTSFYRPVPANMAESWVEKVADRSGFRFTYKLHQSFTHERSAYTAAALRMFLDGVDPLWRGNRLGCLLAQFPWSFRRTAENEAWLKRLSRDLAEYPIVVELRHASWDHGDVLAMLRSCGLGLCNIDQPVLRDSLAPAANVTSDVAYVRFHGRRYDTWFADDVPSFERYNYLYTSEELADWLPRIHAMSEAADEVYVLTNNHYRGQGPVNALQLRSMLGGSCTHIPSCLLDHYPDLRTLLPPEKQSFPDTLF